MTTSSTSTSTSSRTLKKSESKDDDEDSNNNTTSKDDINSLTFANMDLSPKIVADLVKLLRTGRSWQRVELIECTNSVTIAMILSISTVLENVRGFQLQCSELHPQVIMAIGTALQTNSPTVYFGFNVPWTGQAMSSMARGLAVNTTVQTLDLSGSTLDEEETVKIFVGGLRKNTSLKSLKLVGCGLSDTHIELLVVRAIRDHKVLKELHLDQNYCRVKGMEAIAKLLAPSSTCQLAKLKLSHQHVTSSTSTATMTNDSIFDIAPLADALAKNKVLTLLDLSSNCPLQGTKRVLDIFKLASALQSNTTLTTLHLATNNITDADLNKLVTLLSHNNNTTITTLDLQNNRISNDGIANFVKQVHTMKGLRKLFLGGNMFGRIGIQTLLEKLPTKIELAT